ncbi:16S rRNA (cytidine(1402)-2'-O)-methyltransferase [Halorhodospira halochloris]|uniref:16S rRNA (cytidine(1402)-2'-O)-methyltransferase n=1 Tax=Halorhodospira halochloris TaxID=1052 RepID=UPI001EE7F102|nr:16S rRNA (cytidine(1402)-2'-O)-methyltransferase [Halorhodospira halochloris]MCG5548141.1 16S rRNA (cytidine(1402)-2'-O)-methyltransferase [Halorhodospira halochloris]
MSNSLAPPSTGVLSVIATPIGNMRDITLRALDTLACVDWVAAEDTRRSRYLLDYYNLNARTISLHEHNEASRIPRLLRLLASGYSVGLVSDAGTPLISDPGARLVAAAHANEVRVVTVPGASSVTAALAVAGFDVDGFEFAGFLPAKSSARRKAVEELAIRRKPTIYFEAPHRVVESLQDLREICGGGRWVVVARELTKVHETLLRGPLQDVIQMVEANKNQQRGEFVVIVAGRPDQQSTGESLQLDIDDVLRPLLAELSVKQAASLAARITGAKRNMLYKRALEISRSSSA